MGLTIRPSSCGKYEHWHDALRDLAIACFRRRISAPDRVRADHIAEALIDRGSVDLPIRTAEQSATRATRSAIDEQLLGMLMIAMQRRIVQCGDGRWREAQVFADELVRRLVNQGLAVFASDRPSAPIYIEVTLQGIQALQAAHLIAARPAMTRLTRCIAIVADRPS
jgi:hypothetical protein